MKFSLGSRPLGCLHRCNRCNQLIRIIFMNIGNFCSLRIRSYILSKPWKVINLYSAIVYYILNWVPAAIKALKKYCANKYLWYTGNKFFTTMANYSSSLGLLIICVALALHLVMKAEKDSFSSWLVVSRSLLVMSTSILYLYFLWNSRQMSSQLLTLTSSRLRNHLRAATVSVFWNTWASTSSIMPRGYIALIYIFRWDFGQLIPSNLFRFGILNLGGNLALGNRESESLSISSSILQALLIICYILFILSLIFFLVSKVGGLWSALSPLDYSSNSETVASYNSCLPSTKSD